MEPKQIEKNWKFAYDYAIYFLPNSIDAAWIAANPNVLYKPDGTGYLIDLNTVGNNIAAWLRTYGGKIDFTRSYYLIERTHVLPPTQMSIPQNPVTGSITLADLKTKIKNRNGNFENDKYNHFIRIYETGGMIDVEILTTFIPDQNYYSIPLFRSMVRTHAAVQFDFFKGTVNNNPNVMIIRVGVGNYTFYDFSHNPLYGEVIVSPF